MGKRFIIDSIDAKLGSVEKEKKFDLWCVAVSITICALSVWAFLALGTEHTVLSFFALVGMVAGAGIGTCMLKEYFDDCRKAKQQKK